MSSENDPQPYFDDATLAERPELKRIMAVMGGTPLPTEPITKPSPAPVETTQTPPTPELPSPAAYVPPPPTVTTPVYQSVSPDVDYCIEHHKMDLIRLATWLRGIKSSEGQKLKMKFPGGGFGISIPVVNTNLHNGLLTVTVNKQEGMGIELDIGTNLNVDWGESGMNKATYLGEVPLARDLPYCFFLFLLQTELDNTAPVS